jgi:hypothetical protein
MSDFALQWLTERASPPGTMACGLRSPDGNFVCHSVEETLPAAIIENILGHFDSIAGAVFTESPAPCWSTWAFEHGQVRFVDRVDGWRLALVIRNGSDATPTLDLLSLEFLLLQFGGEIASAPGYAPDSSELDSQQQEPQL